MGIILLEKLNWVEYSVSQLREVHQNNLTPNSFPIPGRQNGLMLVKAFSTYEVLVNPATSATFRKTNPVPRRTLGILGCC